MLFFPTILPVVPTYSVSPLIGSIVMQFIFDPSYIPPPTSNQLYPPSTVFNSWQMSSPGFDKISDSKSYIGLKIAIYITSESLGSIAAVKDL